MALIFSRVVALFVSFCVYTQPILAEIEEPYSNNYNIANGQTDNSLQEDFPYLYSSNKRCSRSFCEAYWSTSGSLCVSDSNWGIDYDPEDENKCSLDIDFNFPVYCEEPCEDEASELTKTYIALMAIAGGAVALLIVLVLIFYLRPRKNNQKIDTPQDGDQVKSKVMKHSDTANTELYSDENRSDSASEKGSDRKIVIARESETGSRKPLPGDNIFQDEPYVPRRKKGKKGMPTSEKQESNKEVMNSEPPRLDSDEELGNPTTSKVSQPLPGDFIFDMH